MAIKDRVLATVRQHSGKDALRSFTKHILNPAMLRIAGRRFCYAAVLRHTGRRSGAEYATPVVADRTEDGFVIPLPYGPRTDWVRNVRAAGHATVETKGDSYRVTAPEILDAAAALPQVRPSHARGWRRLGIERYLKLTIDTGEPGAAPEEQPGQHD
ncbi:MULTISPECIES: nitroreductase family deazaflavin-dependent oxidoreductase [Amycolatopsis]|uniref:Nitroreductase family deazaflavin-dependent oxidoreductase n=1 Tax=Amycolatopsis dendrobii TaxID=2760662 RepID=A0A7W3W6C5_9PSEU|nr:MULTISPECIES: nitroreductase family deazaflavin-dependent oxidoreductase [Amycolatopsis]MBB1159558.1 nitroreductase family deazaflavin-dependent oxidoreductase [Amycolatopsis dendrobii]UKD57359.1 nitroreductase family deazaflavin-dependent oxidoreductase [Amycolatopsis sp. FU40]